VKDDETRVFTEFWNSDDETRVFTEFWNSAMLGTIGGSILFFGLGLLTINSLLSVIVCSCSVPLFYLSWRANLKYNELRKLIIER